MAILLTADQVPKFWEAIKFSCINADSVEVKYRSSYLTRLLYQLLSGKAQCFVRLDNKRMLQALAITKIMIDEISDKKTLFVSCLYSFTKVDVALWQNDMRFLKKFAQENDCITITCNTVSNKVAQLCESIGMGYRHKSYILHLGGD